MYFSRDNKQYIEDIYLTDILYSSDREFSWTVTAIELLEKRNLYLQNFVQYSRSGRLLLA